MLWADREACHLVLRRVKRTVSKANHPSLKATRGASDTCRKNFTHGNIRERFTLYRCETDNRNSDSQRWYGWKVMDYLPYSPDFAPCDFYFFGPLKKSSWLASDLQHMPTSSKLQSPKMDFIYARMRSCFSERVRQMLKCQWCLRGGLMWSIC